jgi:hypothetical protein
VTDPSQVISLELGLAFVSSETTLVSRRNLKARAPRPASRRFGLETDTRDRHQEILEVLCRRRADEIAIGDNHNSVLAMPRHDPGSLAMRPFDDLAEASLGILKLSSVHCSDTCEQWHSSVKIPNYQYVAIGVAALCEIW